jgi:hypothetical protein
MGCNIIENLIILWFFLQISSLKGRVHRNVYSNCVARVSIFCTYICVGDVLDSWEIYYDLSFTFVYFALGLSHV